MLGEALSRGIKTIRFDSEPLGYITVPERILNLTEARGIFTNCNFFFRGQIEMLSEESLLNNCG